MNRRRLFFSAAGVGLFGLADSAFLLWLHLASGVREGVCKPGRWFSCAALGEKAYSEWFGIPVPVFSLLFYAWVIAVAVWGATSRDEVQQRRNGAVLWIFACLAMASTIWMAGVSAFVFRTLCPFCAVLYVVSLALAYLAWHLRRGASDELFDSVFRFARQTQVGIGMASTVVLLCGAIWVLRHPSHASGPKVAVKFEETDLLRTAGSPTAAVTIVEFSDFQCPHCKIAADVMREVKNQTGERVKFTYRFFPLDAACNPMGGKHPHACRAAGAAYCASLQNRFWPYHDLLFTSQEALPDDRLLEFARATELDILKFRSCLDDETTQAAVRRDLTEGIALRIDSTPTLFLNGMKYEGPLTVSAIVDAVMSQPQ